MIYVIIILICVLLLFISDALQYEWIGYIATCLAIGTLATSCAQSDWFERKEKKRKELEVKEAQPHIIREADGCKVYTFKANGRWHYFTKCGKDVTTESSYSVSCGKNCSKTEVETIITEVK